MPVRLEGLTLDAPPRAPIRLEGLRLRTPQDEFADAANDLGVTPEEYAASSMDSSDVIDQPAGEAVRIGPSKIHGHGSFTTNKVKAGQPIATLAVKNSRTQVGRYSNHADDPNSETKIVGDRLVSIAKRDLEPGEEVTIDYRQAVANRQKLAEKFKPVRLEGLKVVRADAGRLFDADGGGYDYEGAKSAGIEPDEAGHWASRDPNTGLLLKGRAHPTWNKTVEAEQSIGNTIFKKDGRYYSMPSLRKRAVELEGLKVVAPGEQGLSYPDVTTLEQAQEVAANWLAPKPAASVRMPPSPFAVSGTGPGEVTGTMAKPGTPSQFRKSLETGGENVLSGLAGAGAALLRAGSVAPGAWYPRTPETTARTEQTAQKLDQWAKMLYEDAQRPEMQYKPGSGPWQYIQHVTGQTLPFMATAMAGGYLAGPVGAFLVSSAVEGDNAYREAVGALAKRADWTPEQKEQVAQTERLLVGTINGALEMLEVGNIVRFGKKGVSLVKSLVQAAKARAWKELAKAGGKLTAQGVASAANNGLQEVLQESTNIGAATLHGDQIEFGPDAERVLSAGLGGFTSSLVLGGPSMVREAFRSEQTPEQRPANAPPYRDEQQPPVVREIGTGGQGFTPQFQGNEEELPIIEQAPAPGGSQGSVPMGIVPQETGSPAPGTVTKRAGGWIEPSISPSEDWVSDTYIKGDNGNPLIVFHGTTAQDISEFDKTKIGTGKTIYSDQPWYGDGFSFALNPQEAAAYGPNVLPRMLDIKKPLTVKADPLRPMQWQEKIAELRENDPEIDGVIVQDTFSGQLIEVVAFDPSQVKPVPIGILEQYRGQPWADAALARQEATNGRPQPVPTVAPSPAETAPAVPTGGQQAAEVTDEQRRQYAQDNDLPIEEVTDEMVRTELDAKSPRVDAESPKVTTPSQATVASKEPWQMTKADFIAAVRAGRDFPQLGVNPTPLSTLRAASDWERIDEQAAAHHEAEAVKAFLDRKTIPPEVLADYPELQKQPPAATIPAMTEPKGAGAASESPSPQAPGEVANTLPQLVAQRGRQEVEELIGDWDRNAHLSEDGKHITTFADPRNMTGKVRASTKEFLTWVRTRKPEAEEAPVSPADTSWIAERIQQQLDAGEHPGVDAQWVDTGKVRLPAGYVKDGNLYVYRPDPSPRSESAGSPPTAKEDLTVETPVEAERGKAEEGPYTEELRQDLGVSKDLLDAYDPEKAVGKLGNDMTTAEKYAAIVKAIEAGRPIQVATQLRVTPLKKPDQIRLSPKGNVMTREGSKWVTLLPEQVDRLATQAGVKFKPTELEPIDYGKIKAEEETATTEEAPLEKARRELNDTGKTAADQKQAQSEPQNREGGTATANETTAAETLAKAGLKVEKVTAKSGRDYWQVTGKGTYEHKDLLDKVSQAIDKRVVKPSKKYENGKKVWFRSFFNADPTEEIAKALQGLPAEAAVGGRPGTTGTPEGPGNSESGAEDLERERRRTEEDARPVRNRVDRGRQSELLDADTVRLISQGLEHHIPQVVIDEQLEDVALGITSFENGNRLFLVANEAGTGKTYTLGGLIRELKRRGHKKIIYVTLNEDLIEQFHENLADYGLEGVRSHTYSAIRGGHLDAKDAIVILDEAHKAKDVTSQQGKVAQDLMKQARFTILSSATPFENPVEAAYLDATGIFSSVGGHHEWAKMYGATVIKRKYFDYAAGKEVIEERLRWDGGAQHIEDQIAARNWFRRKGAFTNRRKKLPPGTATTTFRRNPVAQEYVNLVDAVTGAYAGAADLADEAMMDGATKAMISMHRVNMTKRILEAAKVDAGIARGKELLTEGKQIVFFVETKAERRIGRFRMSGDTKGKLYTWPEMQREMEKYEERVRATSAQTGGFGKRPKQPFSDAILFIAQAMNEAGIDQELPSVSDHLRTAFPDAAVYTGEVSAAQAKKNLRLWKDGKRKVLIATMAKGGTGLSLHDVTGNMPIRAQVGINLPWTATAIDQTSGRLARYGTAKPVEIDWLFADNIGFERELARRVGGRMADMGALVRGLKLDAADALQDFNFEDEFNAGSVQMHERADEASAETEAVDPVEEAYRTATNLEKSRNRSTGDFDYFETPYPLAVFMVRVSGAQVGQKLLEPSAGQGSLLKWLPSGDIDIDAVEISQLRTEELQGKFPRANVVQANFMEWQPQGEYDTILMNPPFSSTKGVGYQDIAHVMKAYGHLKEGGRLVAIMGEGPFFRQGKQDTAFREWLDEVGAQVVKLPPDTFKQSGTKVNVRLVVIDKGAAPGRSDIELSDMDVDTLREFEDSITPRQPSAEQRWAELEKEIDERKKQIADFVAKNKGKAHQFISKDETRGVLVSLSTKQGHKGEWQYSWFDDAGFGGDTQFKTYDEAIKEAFTEGFKPTTDDVIGKFSKTEKWKRGLEATLVAQMANGFAAHGETDSYTRIMDAWQKGGLEAARKEYDAIKAGPVPPYKTSKINLKKWDIPTHGGTHPTEADIYTGPLPREGEWRIDWDGSLSQLRKVNIEDLTFGEAIDDPGIAESVGKYTTWWKQGKRPFPPDVVVNVADSTHPVLRTINRRRVLGAKYAGAKTMLAWVSDSLPSGRPMYMHEAMIREALTNGNLTPEDAIKIHKADYPQLETWPEYQRAIGKDAQDAALEELEQKVDAAQDAEKMVYTSIPAQWRDEHELTDWGKNGIRTVGNRKVAGRKSFVWQSECEQLPTRLPKSTMDALKEKTDEWWHVKNRRGEDYYLVAKHAVEELRKELPPEAWQQREKPARSPKQRLNDTVMSMKIAQKRDGKITDGTLGENILSLMGDLGLTEADLSPKLIEYVKAYRDEQESQTAVGDNQPGVEQEVRAEADEDLDERASIQTEDAAGEIGDFLDGLVTEEPAKPSKPGQITDLLGNPIFTASTGRKQGNLGLTFDPGPERVVQIKSELAKDIARKVAKAEESKTHSEIQDWYADLDGFYLKNYADPKTGMPANRDLFNNPDNAVAEIKEALDQAVKGGRLFGGAEPPADNAGEDVHETERRYNNFLQLSADTPKQLRPADTYRVLEAAQQEGMLDGFYEWLKGQGIQDRTREALDKDYTELKGEQPEADDGGEGPSVPPGFRPGFAGLGAPAGMAGANVPPIVVAEPDLPKVQFKQYPKDISPIAENINTLSNAAQNTKHPTIIRVANELVDTSIVMREEIQRRIMDGTEQYKQLPKEYRTNKGARFLELMDSEYSPDQIDAAAEIPAAVKPVLKYFKQVEEDIRLSIIRQKRAMAQAMHMHQPTETLVELGREKGLNWEAQERQFGGIKTLSVHDADTDTFLNKEKAAKALAELDIPDTWGRQWSHIQHIFFGQYNLKVVDPDGQSHFIGTAETQAQAVDKLMDWHQLRKEAGEDTEGWRLTVDRDFSMPYDMTRLSTGQYHHLQKELKEALEAERAEIEDATRGIIGKQSSKRKFWGALMQRKGAQGYSTDFLRVWEASIGQYVRWKHLSALNAKVTPMIEGLRAEALPGWANHLEMHRDNLMGRKRSTAAHWLDDRLSRIPGIRQYVKPYVLERNIGRLKTLNYWRHLQTVRFYVVNSLQPIQTLWPVVGEKGFYRAVKLYYSDEGQALLQQYGIETEGKFKEAGVVAPKKTKGWSPAALSERRNQGLAFLALYEQGIDIGMSEAEAARYGRLRGQVFTQFAHSQADVPKFMMGNLGGLIFQYRRFTIKNLELVSRLAREGDLAGVARWLTALVGIGGLSVFLRVATSLPVAGYLTYEAYKWIKDRYGKDVADTIHHGLPALLGLDLSGSVTPVDVPYGRTLGEKIGNIVLGPTGQTVQRLVADMRNTDVAKETGLAARAGKSLLDSSPTLKQFGNLIKALERDTGNLDAKQRQNYKLEIIDLWKKALGFTPETESLQRMQIEAMLSVKDAYDKRMDQVALARIGGDEKRAAQLIVQWNAMFPEAPMTVKDSDQRVKTRTQASKETKVGRAHESLPKNIEAAFPEVMADRLRALPSDELTRMRTANTYKSFSRPSRATNYEVHVPGEPVKGSQELVRQIDAELDRRSQENNR